MAFAFSTVRNCSSFSDTLIGCFQPGLATETTGLELLCCSPCCRVCGADWSFAEHYMDVDAGQWLSDANSHASADDGVGGASFGCRGLSSGWKFSFFACTTAAADFGLLLGAALVVTADAGAGVRGSRIVVRRVCNSFLVAPHLKVFVVLRFFSRLFPCCCFLNQSFGGAANSIRMRLVYRYGYRHEKQTNK